VKWRKKGNKEVGYDHQRLRDSLIRSDEGKRGDWLLQALWLEIGHERSHWRPSPSNLWKVRERFVVRREEGEAGVIS
jgi:hypothetical protein